MIQISTDEVYGSLLDGFATEDSPLAPNSPYSSSKAGADLICRSYVKTYNLDIRVTRCTNNFGPYQNPEKLIPKIITNLILGRRVPIYGNGQNVRDWIHVSDHVDGILKVVKGGRPGDVFNIGSNNLRSNLQVVQTILEIMGLGEDYIEFVADRPGHDFRYALDYGFIQAECGYNANVDFISGIRDTVEWYRSSRAWWEPLLSKA
jgi:dTDP-glucose 4,6-dehydratase